MIANVILSPGHTGDYTVVAEFGDYINIS